MGSAAVFPNDDLMELMARRFRLLGEPIRLHLLHLLQEREYSVNELTAAVHANQSTVSRHLSALYDGGMVNRRRDGSNVHYSISDPLVIELCRMVCKHARDEAESALELLAPGLSRRARAQRMG